MEKCYENLLKYFVFLCNLIFALAGACLVGFGAYVQVWSSHLILNCILKSNFLHRSTLEDLRNS